MNENKLNIIAISTLIAIVLIIQGVKFLAGNNPAKAEKVLKVEGFESVKFTGYKIFHCGRYFYSTGFSGVKNGTEVSGAVCSGLLFKGSLIKYD